MTDGEMKPRQWASQAAPNQSHEDAHVTIDRRPTDKWPAGRRAAQIGRKRVDLAARKLERRRRRPARVAFGADN